MHILSAEQFDRGGLEEIFEATDQIRSDYDESRVVLAARHAGKRAAILFYEASTRTKSSFTQAAQSMGVSCDTHDNAGQFSSAAKGETIEDTVQMFNQYGTDVLVIRHNETGGVARAAEVAHMPVINAGDGKGEHPTQSLLDAYTIWKNHKTLDGLRIVIGGDLTHGRTARSLAKTLALFEGNHLIFNSIPELQMGHDVKEYLEARGTSYEETEDMKTAFKDADVVYWTRLQRERLPEGFKVNQSFVIDEKAMSYLSDRATVMHPLPRVDEIDKKVDVDPRAKYFEQAGNGMWVRMALLDMLLTQTQ